MGFASLQVWLDGAVARLVVGSKGAAVVQAALSLHRSHTPPTGAHLTGDQSAPPCSAPARISAPSCWFCDQYIWA
jgi:hypothetical protein